MNADFELNEIMDCLADARALDCDNIDYILAINSDNNPCFNHKLHLSFKAKLGSRRGIIIEGERAIRLIKLYSLYAFTDKLIIGSLDLPYGRKLRNLLESGIATEDELINDVILGAM